MSVSNDTAATQDDSAVTAGSGTAADAARRPAVIANYNDYAPGDTATITASGFAAGTTLAFQVVHVSDPGADGVWGTEDDVVGDNSGAGHDTWYVTDGVRTVSAGADGELGTEDDVVTGDLDGVANGTVVTGWYVNPDDSLGARFLLSASAIDPGADAVAGTADDSAVGPAALATFTDATETDLTAPGASTAIGDVIFADAANLGAETANYYSFLAVTDTGGEVHGFNSDDEATGDGLDPSNAEIFSPQTQTVRLSDVPVKIVGDVAYYEMRLNLNQSDGGQSGAMSLDAFRVYLSESGEIQSLASLEAQTLIYDMDAAATGGDRTLLLSEASTGNGADDYSVLVPVTAFTNADTSQIFLYLYVQMGAKSGVYAESGGIEYWQLQSPGTLTGVKFNDRDNNGARDVDGADDILGNADDESGIGGVTIFIDTDQDGVLDGGERSTTTAGDGSYSFVGVAPGIHQIDEVPQPGWGQTTGAFETAVIVGTAAQTVSVDPIGNFLLPTPPEPAPVITIVKDGPATIAEGGANVVYTFTITAAAGNAATDPVTITSLADDTFSPADDAALFAAALVAWQVAHPGATEIVLNPGDSFSFSFDPAGTLTLDAGQSHTNTVTVAGTDDDGTAVGDTAPHTITGTNLTPTITIDKTGPATIAEGGVNVVYTFTISAAAGNAATDPVTITSLADDSFSPADDAALFATALAAWQVAHPGTTEIVLDPGDSFSFSFDPAGALTLAAGQTHTNTVTVEGRDDENTPASDTDPHTITGANLTPTITIVKDGPATIAEGGANVVYTFTISAATANAATDPVTITSLADDSFSPADDAALFAAALAAWQAVPGNETATEIVLDPGNSFSFSFDPAGTLTLDAGQTHTNTVTVEGRDDENTPASDTDPHTITATNLTPQITIDKTGPATIAEGGANVVYTFTITAAAGNAATDSVTITSLADDSFSPADDAALFAAALAAWQVAHPGATQIVLTPGDAFSFSFDPAGTLMLDAGQSHTNTITVAGHDDENTPVSDTDPHTITGANLTPQITIVKDGPATIAEGGANVVYTFTISAASANAATDPVTITSLADDSFSPADDAALLAAALAAWRAVPGNETATEIVLDPGDAFSFSFDPAGTLTLDAGQTHTNTITVAGHDDENTPVSDTDPHTITGTNPTPEPAPGITIVKDGPATVAEGGANVVYTFTITAAAANAATDPVTITSLADDSFSPADDAALFAAALAAWRAVPGNETATEIVLDPDDSFSFTLDPTGALTLDAGQTHTNTVTVEGHDDESTPVSDTDPHTITAANLAPEITIDKLIDANGDAIFSDSEARDPGTYTVTYRYTITAAGTNASTDPVTITSLSDDRLGDLLDDAVATNGGNPIVLAANESFSFDVTTTVTLVGDPYVNTVTVQGRDDEGTDTNAATDNAAILPAAQLSKPRVSIDKTVTDLANPDDTDGGSTADQAGDVINYRIEVRNTGGVALTGVRVTDKVEGYGATAAVLASGDGNNNGKLDVGETWLYSATYTITQSDIDRASGYRSDGDIDNKATVDTDQTLPRSDSASVPIDATVDLRGYKYADLNGDGDRDLGEAALRNWRIQLWQDDGDGVFDAGDRLVASTYTNRDGAYVFDDLAVAGHTYFVKEQQRDGWTQTGPLNDADDSDQVTTQGGIYKVEVETGSDTLGSLDFGNRMAPGPGVRSPDFWKSDGAAFWDGVVGDESKAGQPSFPDGELLYAVDGSGDGVKDATKGLLIGDYDKDGVKGAGEDVFFVSLADARKLIDASEKQLQDGRGVLARDAVASWLNYLAGNPIGEVAPDDGKYSPKEGLDDAIDWLQAATNAPGGAANAGFGSWPGSGGAVKSNSQAWLLGHNTDGDSAFEVPGGNYIHGQIDEYNSTGRIDGTFYAFDGDTSGSDPYYLQYWAILKTAEDHY